MLDTSGVAEPDFVLDPDNDTCVLPDPAVDISDKVPPERVDLKPERVADVPDKIPPERIDLTPGRVADVSGKVTLDHVGLKPDFETLERAVI